MSYYLDAAEYPQLGNAAPVSSPSAHGHWQAQDWSVQKTDEEIARELQAQFDSEAASYVPAPLEEDPVDLDASYALALQMAEEAEAYAEDLMTHSPKAPLDAPSDRLQRRREVQRFLSQHLDLDDFPAQIQWEEDEEEELVDEVYQQYQKDIFLLESAPKRSKHDTKLDSLRNAEKMELEVDMVTGDMLGLQLPAPVYGRTMKQHRKKAALQSRARADKADRKARDRVLDGNVAMILYKMLNNCVLDRIDGVISSGKESQVYHCIGGAMDPPLYPIIPGSSYALKIYDLDPSTFRDRSKYIEGEHRFQGRPLNNLRKVIALWAEKEMRNLKRMRKHGIRCPTPILLRDNVLLMEFIGEDGLDAPRLKNVKLSVGGSRSKRYYEQCVRMMMVAYQKCKLVHADLSEYNMLVLREEIYFIDVSQSLESEHPHAAEFLLRDCHRVTDFFGQFTQVRSAEELLSHVMEGDLSEEEGQDTSQAQEEDNKL